MKVKELIKQLLDEDMDDKIRIQVGGGAHSIGIDGIITEGHSSTYNGIILIVPEFNLVTDFKKS